MSYQSFNDNFFHLTQSNRFSSAHPFPWVHARKAMKKIAVGQVLQVLGDHGPALKNIPQRGSPTAFSGWVA